MGDTSPFLQWRKWKQAGGVYFISREKKNLTFMIMADLDYDREDPVNAGVRSYELVGCCVGIAMHRVVYKCPLTGETYRFITSLTNIPPGLIAYLYKTRWDLEKIFDEVKNKLAEKKAWATSDTAKNMQVILPSETDAIAVGTRRKGIARCGRLLSTYTTGLGYSRPVLVF